MRAPKKKARKVAPARGEGLEDLRASLDRIDEEIVRLIGERLGVAGRIGLEKASRADLPSGGVRDPARERQVLERAERWARERGVPVALVRKFFEDLVAYATTRQATLLGRNGADPRAAPPRRGGDRRPVGRGEHGLGTAEGGDGRSPSTRLRSSQAVGGPA